MTISIITASYNYEKYIKDTIESVLAQTYSDWEMIIVDDGSKDKSRDIIKEYCEKDSRIKLYTHEKNVNKGLAETIQLGLTKASGDWVVFLESDDTITHDYISEKLKVVDEYPDIKFIFNDVKLFGEGSSLNAQNTGLDYFEHRKKILSKRKFPANLSEEFINFNFIPTFSCVMVKRELLNSLEYKSPIPQFLDTFLWSQIIGRNDIYYIDKKLTNFRIHGDSYNNNRVSEEDKEIFQDVLFKNIYGVSMNKKKYFKLKIQIKKMFQNFLKVRRSIIRIHVKKSFCEICLFGKSFSFLKGDKISIVLPVYNSEGGIKRCLSSLVNQTYRNIEIIVVYLKSTDKTLDIIKSFNDKRIKIVEQKEKTGPGGARNIGIKAASGKFIGFIEGDDYIPYNYYEKMYSLMLKKRADIVMSEIVGPLKDGTERYVTQIQDSEGYTELYDKLINMNNGAAFNKLFKLSLLKDNNISFTEFYRYEDNPFLLKALYYSKKVYLTNVVKYYYCCFDDVFSDKYIKVLKNSIMPIAKEMVDFAKEKSFLPEELYETKAFILRSFANVFMDDKEVYENVYDLMGFSFFERYRRNDSVVCSIVNKQPKKTFFKWLFSCENSYTHKVITILGVKASFRSKKLVLKRRIEEINNRLNSIECRQANEQKMLSNISEQIEKLRDENIEIKKKYIAIAAELSNCIKKSQYEIIGEKVRSKMGKHSYACEYFTVASEETTIGAYCSIANNVSIGTTHHPTNFISTHPFCYFEPCKLDKSSKQAHFDYVKPCHIGNDVWIGKSVIIMDGITVGDGAIIGANSVVTHDVPPYSIVVGSPARIINYRFDDETIKKLLELKWWNLSDEELAHLPYDNIIECINILENRKGKTCI